MLSANDATCIFVAILFVELPLLFVFLFFKFLFFSFFLLDQMQLQLLSTSLIVSILWSISPIVRKYVLRTLPVEMAMLLFSSMHYMCILIFTLGFRRPIINAALPHVTYNVLGLALVTVLVAGLLPNYMYNVILKNNDAYRVNALVSITPVFITLFAVLFLGEHVTLRSGAGVLLITIGIVLLTLK